MYSFHLATQLSGEKHACETHKSKGSTFIPVCLKRCSKRSQILERDRAHKWLGCMISTHTDGSHGLDLEHHLQAASRAFYANKSILSDKSVSIAQRLAYFDAMVTPVACFASGHRKIYKQDLRKLDVKFRKLVRTIVGPPGGLDWSAPWHHILYEWNARALECAEQAGVKLWSRRCLEQHWQLANYIANLPDNRWLKRALAWTAGRRRRIGRPTNTWDAQIQMYCRWRNLGNCIMSRLDWYKDDNFQSNAV